MKNMIFAFVMFFMADFAEARYTRHSGYCSDRDYQNGCRVNDAVGTGGAMPIGIYCECFSKRKSVYRKTAYEEVKSVCPQSKELPYWDKESCECQGGSFDESTGQCNTY